MLDPGIFSFFFTGRAGDGHPATGLQFSLSPIPAIFNKVNIMTKPSRPSAPRNPMTPAAASRIQSATAKQHGGAVPAGSFAARVQSAAAGHAAVKTK